jgi:hypothetical protein
VAYVRESSRAGRQRGVRTLCALTILTMVSATPLRRSVSLASKCCRLAGWALAQAELCILHAGAHTVVEGQHGACACDVWRQRPHGACCLVARVARSSKFESETTVGRESGTKSHSGSVRRSSWVYSTCPLKGVVVAALCATHEASP